MDPETPTQQLRSLVGLDAGVDKLIAAHPNALQWVFKALAETGNQDTVRALFCNRDLPHELILDLGPKFPDQLTESPLLDHFMEVIPDLLDRVPGILMSPKCPEDLIEAVVLNGNWSQRLSILGNTSLGADSKQSLSANRIHQDARERMRKLVQEQGNPAVKKAVELYSETFTPFCMPLFLPLDRSNPEHRLADQVTGGFPFTSAFWPWPSNEQGSAMHFLAQVNLDRASSLLGHNFGSGLLQIWMPYYDDTEVIISRVIPSGDLSNNLDTDYPEACEAEAQAYGLFHWNSISPCKPRIDWIRFGNMYHRDPWSLMSELGESNSGVSLDAVEDELLDISEKLSELVVPHASLSGYFSHPPRIFLGGYPFGYGNGWDQFHRPHTRMLLNMMSEGDPLWHLGVSVKKINAETTEFRLGVACTN